MKKGVLLICILLNTILILSSCIETQQLEKLGIISARGVDLTEDGKLEATISIFQFEAQSQDFVRIISGKGDTIKGTVTNATNESNYQLAPGKLQVELYGKKMAESGLYRALDTLRRDANVPDTVYLAMSDTTAKEIMTVPEENITSNIGQYLEGLISEIAQDHNFPHVSIQEFLSTINLSGKDAVMPVISMNEQGAPELSAIGVFQEDKYVGEISLKEMVLFNIMESLTTSKLYELTIPTAPFGKNIDDPEGDTFHVALMIERGKSKINLKEKSIPSFETNISIEASALEVSERLDFSSPDVIHTLEDEINKYIQSRYEKMVKDVQAMNADPFGYGIIYRINQPDGKLDIKEWQKLFPSAEITFNIDTKIIRNGVTEN